MVEVNITLVGTKIVQDTKFLAFEKNNNVDVINITVDTNGEWTYKLDVRYPDKCCTGDAQYNIINLVKTDDIYMAVLTSDMLPFSGKYTMQIRAINGDKIQHSDTFDAWVKYSIEPGETYNPVPSEFYQIEANVTEINNHPPYPSDDGYWMIYNVNTHEYEKSEIPVIAKSGDGLPDIDITTDGKYLSNDGTKAIWTDVEAEQELFICTITGSGTESSPYACDKTTAEIAQAAAAGKVVYALSGSICYPVTIANAGMVRFEVLNGVNDTGFMLLPNGIMTKFQNKLQQTSGRVTSLSAASTDAQYPSAKCVYDAIQEAKNDVSLGITGATAGQIAKITAVDAQGLPTKWEPVDLPSGGGGDSVEWFEVIDMETVENVTDLRISTDTNGRAISGYNALEMVLSLVVPADSTQTSTKGELWVYPFVDTGNNYRSVINLANWKTSKRSQNFLFSGTSRCMYMSSMTTTPIAQESLEFPFDGVRLSIHGDGDHLPIGTKIRCLVLSKGWKA